MPDRRLDTALYPVSVRKGRESWHIGALTGDPAFGDKLAERLRSVAGVQRVTVDADAGRVVIAFDPEACPEGMASRLFDFLAAAATPEPLPAADPSPPAPPAPTPPPADTQAGDTHTADPAETPASDMPPSDRAPSLAPLPLEQAMPPGLGAIVKVLRAADARWGEFAFPAAVSVASQALHLLQANAFIATVNRARQQGVAAAGGGGPALLGPLALSMLLTAASLTVQYRRKVGWRQLAEDVRTRLRSRLMQHLLTLDLAFFDERGTGHLMDLLMRDTQTVADFAAKLPDEIIEKAITAAYGAFTLVTLSPRLAATAAVPLSLLALPSVAMGAGTARKVARAGQLRGDLTQSMQSILSGIADVKVFQLEDQETDRVRRAAGDAADASVDSFAAAKLTGLLGQAVGAGGFGLVAAFGSALVRGGRIGGGDFARVLHLYPMLLSAVADIQVLFAQYQEAGAAAQRIVELLGREPRVRSGPRAHPVASVRGEIAVERVSFGYAPDRPVLRDISLTVGRGDLVALVGPTGSGKSTLLRLLARLYDVDGGTIRLDGHDIRSLDLTDMRRAVTLVSQDAHLFPGTIRDNLLCGRPDADDATLVDAMRKAGAADLLAKLPGGLSAPVGEGGRLLSGGERQRVAIARAILRASPILLLDEITAHLDSRTEDEVRLSIQELARARTVVMVTHRLSTIRDASRIVVLQDGEIAETGTHDELVGNGRLYRQLWRMQADGGR